ncbi:uncharacterized protein [Ptychodera flava]|uniref:uncharacterized protein n=1 Tax=Ptychodera flava TaxID=63121 RepID=UPI00396A947A
MFISALYRDAAVSATKLSPTASNTAAPRTAIVIFYQYGEARLSKTCYHRVKHLSNRSWRIGCHSRDHFNFYSMYICCPRHWYMVWHFIFGIWLYWTGICMQKDQSDDDSIHDPINNIGFVGSTILGVISILSFVNEYNPPQFAVDMLLLVIAAMETAVGIIASVLCCRTICYCGSKTSCTVFPCKYKLSEMEHRITAYDWQATLVHRQLKFRTKSHKMATE